MPRPGSADHPLRVGVIGSGPAAFYVVEHLFRAKELSVRVDMFERLPMPFGLVRYGVAPDHEKIKSVIRVYERLAERPEFRFFGNVEVGRHVTVDELAARYHALCFATGAQTDRAMGIPGEELSGSHAATEFVAWYNGHPDFVDRTFDLSAERVAVVGVGNVAVDVARILCRTSEELARTDIAEYALEALRRSAVREVYILGRRGPLQAAFTNAEVKELGELEAAGVRVLPNEVVLDPLSREDLERSDDRAQRKKVEILQGFAGRRVADKPRTLTLRFLASPTALVGVDGQVRSMRIVQNELYRTGDGTLRPRATARVEELPVDLVFRSVGYRGVAIPGLPFDERHGIVPNDGGRVMEAGTAVPGLYVAGWIKRGPSGVIGTNKPDAGETVAALLEDIGSGRSLSLEGGASDDAVLGLLAQRQAAWISYRDWKRLDAVERERGEAQGRSRAKLTSAADVAAVLGRDTRRGTTALPPAR
ncbi:MAG TPA: FAD-dependent oxidoreductase [Gemmatimonadales bacterium]